MDVDPTVSRCEIAHQPARPLCYNNNNNNNGVYFPSEMYNKIQGSLVTTFK